MAAKRQKSRKKGTPRSHVADASQSGATLCGRATGRLEVYPTLGAARSASELRVCQTCRRKTDDQRWSPASAIRSGASIQLLDSLANPATPPEMMCKDEIDERLVLLRSLMDTGGDIGLNPVGEEAAHLLSASLAAAADHLDYDPDMPGADLADLEDEYDPEM